MKQYYFGFIILSAIISLSSCAREYAYNSDNPEAYKKHWENNEEIKNNELLYQISEECKQNKDKNCIGL